NAIVLQRDNGVEAVLFRDAGARRSRAVTHRAGNAETFAPTLKQLRRDRNRNSSSPIISHFPSVDVIGANTKTGDRARLRRADGLSFRHFIANRHRARDWHSRAATVRKEIQRRLGAHFHLSHHVWKNFPWFVGSFFSAKSEHGHRRDRDQQRN